MFSLSLVKSDIVYSAAYVNAIPFRVSGGPVVSMCWITILNGAILAGANTTPSQYGQWGNCNAAGLGGGAGSFPGGDGGPATQANFGSGFGIFTGDVAGNIYLVDGGITVRKVNRVSGIISTVAGNVARHGETGDGGPGTSASLGTILSIATYQQSALYILQWNRLRKLDLTTDIIHAVTAPSGTPGIAGSLASDYFIGFLAIAGPMFADTRGNVYLPMSEAYVPILLRISPAGRVEHLFFSNTTETGTMFASAFPTFVPAGVSVVSSNYSRACAIDSFDNIYFCSPSSIRMLSNSSGLVITVAGAGGGNYPTSATPLCVSRVTYIFTSAAVSPRLFDCSPSIHTGLSTSSGSQQRLNINVPGEVIYSKFAVTPSRTLVLAENPSQFDITKSWSGTSGEYPLNIHPTFLVAYQLYNTLANFTPSLFRRLPRMDISGTLCGTSLYPNQTLTAESETACQVTCYNTFECQGYSYAASACNLYSSVAQLFPSSFVDSGLLAAS